MKRKFFTALFVISTLTMIAQTKKYLGLELAGSNGLVGVSYDSRFDKNDKFGYKIRLGYGYEYHDGARHWYLSPIKVFFPEDEKINNSITLPISVYYLLGKNKNFLETGLGICTFYADYRNRNEKGLGYFSFARVAYRHESVKNKLSFSAGLDLPFYTPGSGLGYSLALVPSISIAYRLFGETNN